MRKSEKSPELPEPKRELGWAYRAGVKARLSDPQFPDVPDWVGFDMGATSAFQCGFEGGEEPRWVLAVRIGLVPDDGRSFNFADQRFERGVSVLYIHGENRTDNGTFDFFNGGEKRWVAGWLIGQGSDGEPLLADCVDLGPVL